MTETKRENKMDEVKEMVELEMTECKVESDILEDPVAPAWGVFCTGKSCTAQSWGVICG